jgi:replicative DNA helicase
VSYKTELEVINSVCKEKDISVLLVDSVDDVFENFGDSWQYIKQHYSKYRAVPDFDLLQNHLGDESDLEIVDVNGPTDYYLDKLKNEYLKQRLETITNKAAAAIRDGKMDPAKVVDVMNTSLAGLMKLTTNVADVDVNDIESAIDHWTHIQEQQQLLGRDIGFKTGFDSIDSSIPNGFAPGNLIYIYGYPGNGKSFLTQLFSTKAYDAGISPMIINLEMSDKDVRDRAFTTLDPGAFNLSDLQRADVDFDTMRAFAKKKLTGPRFMIVGAGGMSNSLTPSQVQGKIDQYKPGIVFIDYVQLMSDNSRSNDLTQKMYNLSKELKRLATSNNVAIAAVSSVKRSQNASRAEMPGIEDIYGGSALEFDADHIIGVHRVPESEFIKIAGMKNRFGPLWEFFARVDLGRGIWEETHEI